MNPRNGAEIDAVVLNLNRIETLDEFLMQKSPDKLFIMKNTTNHDTELHKIASRCPN